MQTPLTFIDLQASLHEIIPSALVADKSPREIPQLLSEGYNPTIQTLLFVKFALASLFHINNLLFRVSQLNPQLKSQAY